MKAKKLFRQICTIVLLGIMVLPLAVQAQSETTPPSGDLTTKWWEWAVSIPEASNPIVSSTATDPTGALCNVKQTGASWFLAGTTGGPTITRSCTIPVGKTILIPIITAEWSVAEAEASGNNCFIPGVISGTDETALRACANAAINHVTSKSASIDGVDVQNLDNYRVQSSLFEFDVIKNNVFAIPKGTSKSVSDGYWILIAPLSKGKHILKAHGVAPFPELGFTFDTDVTYNISVVDENQQ